MRPEHLQPGPDMGGYRIALSQSGPNAYSAAIETEWGEVLGRSPRPLASPSAALRQALDSIEAHLARERLHGRKGVAR